MNNNLKATTPFLPTMNDWAELYSAWHEKMAKSLWAYGSPHECQEAVHEAFLKAMGFSDHLHLRDELTPKVAGCWYGFLRNQAKGIMSNYHRRSDRFEPLKEYGLTEEDDEPAAESDFEAADRREFRAKMRRMVDDVCRKAGVDERNRRAFVLFVLDGVDGATVIRKVPQLHNANNLYQIKNRIMKLLIASNDRFEDVFAEMMAA